MLKSAISVRGFELSRPDGSSGSLREAVLAGPGARVHWRSTITSMASGSRLGAVIILAMTVAAAAVGCGAHDVPVTPKPGVAARKVTVIRGDQTYPITAEVTDWGTQLHPQVPEQGLAVHFTYRFTSSNPWIASERVELQACAVDDHRVVILCTSIFNNWLNDDWLVPSTNVNLARTADVLILPYQMDSGLHAGDPKDGDSYVPPQIVGPGEQL